MENILDTIDLLKDKAVPFLEKLESQYNNLLKAEEVLTKEIEEEALGFQQNNTLIKGELENLSDSTEISLEDKKSGRTTLLQKSGAAFNQYIDKLDELKSKKDKIVLQKAEIENNPLIVDLFKAITN